MRQPGFSIVTNSHRFKCAPPILRSLSIHTSAYCSCSLHIHNKKLAKIWYPTENRGHFDVGEINSLLIFQEKEILRVKKTFYT